MDRAAKNEGFCGPLQSVRGVLVSKMKCLSLFILNGSILGPSAFVPVRMARLVLQGKSRASEVVKHDQFASVLRISLVSAEGTGRILLGESALDRDPLSLLKT